VGEERHGTTGGLSVEENHYCSEAQKKKGIGGGEGENHCAVGRGPEARQRFSITEDQNETRWVEHIKGGGAERPRWRLGQKRKRSLADIGWPGRKIRRQSAEVGCPKGKLRAKQRESEMGEEIAGKGNFDARFFVNPNRDVGTANQDNWIRWLGPKRSL